MPPNTDTEYRFPDETADDAVLLKDGGDIEIEIEDDTPVEDKGKTPMPKPIVEELEKDELDQYDESVKEKLKQMRKVWHDERREKEAALREHQAAVAVAQRLVEENARMKKLISTGEKEYVSSVKSAAKAELAMAKRAYKEAYDAGDADKIIEAQEAMNRASAKLMNAKKLKENSLQNKDFDVQPQPVPQVQRQPVDPKAEAWQERNQWFGKNKSMTAYALGLHEELRDSGVPVGSDEYYRALDRTVRKRFPESFTSTVADEESESASRENSRPKPTTVVAPATRSTAPQKVRLKTSQLSLIKKLGITPEQYVKEFMKEVRNG